MTETIPQPRVAEEEAAIADSPSVETGLLVLAPLRFEANAVRRGLTEPTSHVQRTGMGAARSQKSAAQSKPGPFSAMVVMGTAAGLAADLSPGDMVVATEVSDGETTVELPGADLLAAELRRAGLNARAGRIVQVKKIINSS
jgi:4-hydroxy-3-methylbut-2-enyl diphosphate reductase